MKKRIYIILTLVTLVAIVDIVKNPILFKNTNSFIEGDIVFDNMPAIKTDYILELIKKIPYKPLNSDGNNNIYDVYPLDKYNKTIINGYGNCSNITFGASYELLKDEKEFKIIHFLPKHKWTLGNGHTAMIVKMDSEKIIIDFLEGGVLSGMNQKNIFSISDSLVFTPFNDLKDSSNPYFPRVFKDQVGLISSTSVKSYFQFLDLAYIPLGNKKIEKYIFDGISLFFGFYPEIIVSDINSLVSKKELIRYNIYLLFFRILFTSLIASFTYKFCKGIWRKASNGNRQDLLN